MTYDFYEQLKFSKGARQDTDKDTIMAMLSGCASVVEASEKMDRAGVDYVATLRRGAEVYIDAKTRVRGCSKYWWNGEPELAIETWSVKPNSMTAGKVGWTFDEAKITHMILYTFDPQDCKTAFLFPFHHLRMAARKNIVSWTERYKQAPQFNKCYLSEAVFVPAEEVLRAIGTTYTSTP